MPKPAHIRVTLSGVLGAPAQPLERWSFNVNASRAAGVDGMDKNALDALATSVTAAYTTKLATMFPSDIVLTESRVARVGTDGRVEKFGGGVFAQGIHVADVPGSAAKQAVPAQTALVVSLVTPRSGPSGKGRVFLPWPGYALDSTQKTLSTQNAAAVADLFQQFLGNLIVLGLQPAVVSSKGFESPVGSVKVGRAPDTMRSRRRGVPEGYVSRVID